MTWEVLSGVPVSTPREYRQWAKQCLQLAKESDDAFVHAALTEMALDFRAMAYQLESQMHYPAELQKAQKRTS